MNDYSKQKKGWVTFNGGRDKEKLRQYIAKIATQLTSLNKKGYIYNRNKLIECYNLDGLKGVHAATIVLSKEVKQPKIEV